MRTKAKRHAVSVFTNGKPRARGKGPFRIECHGDEGNAAQIECFVAASEMVACGYGKGFVLRLPTPEHCEHFAAWLNEAAKFTRSKRKQRTAGQRS